LIAKLSDSYALIDSVKYENCVLTKNIKSLENEIEMSKNQLKKFSSDKSYCPLNSLKPHSDKYGLCFKFVASISKTHHVTKGKIAFVPASSNKSKNVVCDALSKHK
jgi:hypothetical protein